MVRSQVFKCHWLRQRFENYIPAAVVEKGWVLYRDPDSSLAGLIKLGHQQHPFLAFCPLLTGQCPAAISRA